MLDRLTSYFVNNIKLLLLLILMIVLLGGASLLSIPKAEDPQFDMPISVVEVIAPGMPPETIETLIVSPIENALNLVENIKSVETKIYQGSITVEVRFLYGTDADSSFDDVSRAVDGVKDLFPVDVQNVSVFKVSPNTVNMLQVALSNEPNDWQTLNRAATNLQKKLQSLSVVRQAQIWGMPNLVVNISVKQLEMINYNIHIDQVSNAIQERASASHGGYIDEEEMRFTVRLSGEYSDFKTLQDTVIKSDGVSVITLADVATLTLEPYKQNNLSYVDQKPVIFLTAQQKMGVNIFTFADKVQEVLKEFQSDFTEIELKEIIKQEKSVEQRVQGFVNDLLSGLILILFCLLFFMGPKQSFWVSLALPLTIFITLVTLNALGFALQQMSIAGIIVALGLLVDNSLVVVEQFAKHKESGRTNRETLTLVLSEVGMPLTAGTLTTVLAFMPMLILSSDTGDFMRAMPVSVTIALIASLFVALIILPALMAIFGVSTHSKYTLSTLLNSFAASSYSRALNKIISYPKITLLIFMSLSIACISLFPKVGVSLFPKAEKSIVIVNIETPSSFSLFGTRDVVLDISKQIKTLPNVQSVVSTIGGSNPRIYYNHLSQRGVTNFAQLMLLTDEYDRDKIQSLISTIRKKYETYENAKIHVYEFQQGPVTDRPITIRIVGDDLDRVKKRSIELESFFKEQNHVFDVRNISNSSGIAVELFVDKHKAEKASITVGAVEAQIRHIINGQSVGNISDKFGTNYPIIVTGDAANRNDLDELYIFNRDGNPIPLSSISSKGYTKLNPPFYHYQRIRMSKVSADVLKPGNVAEITQKIIQHIDTLSWDGGMNYIVGGEEAARRESFGGMSDIMIVVILSIFVLLFIQFNSFAQPAVIISLLPIAFAGGVLGMFVTGISFSMMAFIGLISLIGIMVNDAIIVVDGYNRGIATGASNIESMIASASSRFTPVILTSLTTIVGLLPLTLYGGELWQPMGTVIITGLLFTTLASLVWVPALTILVSGRAKN